MITLTTDEIKSMNKVIDYILDNEEKHYAEHIANGGEQENHVYYHATIMHYILKLKRELPPIKLTGDCSLTLFKNK